MRFRRRREAEVRFTRELRTFDGYHPSGDWEERVQLWITHSVEPARRTRTAGAGSTPSPAASTTALTSAATSPVSSADGASENSALPPVRPQRRRGAAGDLNPLVTSPPAPSKRKKKAS